MCFLICICYFCHTNILWEFKTFAWFIVCEKIFGALGNNCSQHRHPQRRFIFINERKSHQNTRGYKLFYWHSGYENIQDFNRLEVLDITYNHISEVILSRNKYLRSLFISRNNLRTLPDFRINGNTSNCFFPQLELLSVKDNDIQEIRSEYLKCLIHVRKLNLYGNIITLLPNNFLSALLNIQSVQIMLPGTRSLKVEPMPLTRPHSSHLLYHIVFHLCTFSNPWIRRSNFCLNLFI
jgi:hypothetical protein